MVCVVCRGTNNGLCVGGDWVWTDAKEGTTLQCCFILLGISKSAHQGPKTLTQAPLPLSI